MSPNIGAYFNKGIIAAQWCHASSPTRASTPRSGLIIKIRNPLRKALSGMLRPQFSQELRAANDKRGEIYAALYELNDPELIAALRLRQECHLILANGAFKPENGRERRRAQGDEEQGRPPRSPRYRGHFAHNKFVVFCDADGGRRGSCPAAPTGR